MAAVNFASTTCKSLTGVVISVSKVPERIFQRMNSRVVVNGDERTKIMTTRTKVEKKSHVAKLSVGKPCSCKVIKVTKLSSHLKRSNVAY